MKILGMFLIVFFLFPLNGFSFLQRNYKKTMLSIRCQKMQDHIYKRQTFLQKHFDKKKTTLNKKYANQLLRIEKRKLRLSENRYQRMKDNIQEWYRREIKQLEYQEKISQKKIARRKNKLESLIHLALVQ